MTCEVAQIVRLLAILLCCLIGINKAFLRSDDLTVMV